MAFVVVQARCRALQLGTRPDYLICCINRALNQLLLLRVCIASCRSLSHKAGIRIDHRRLNIDTSSYTGGACFIRTTEIGCVKLGAKSGRWSPVWKLMPIYRGRYMDVIRVCIKFTRALLAISIILAKYPSPSKHCSTTYCCAVAASGLLLVCLFNCYITATKQPCCLYGGSLNFRKFG